MNTIATVTDMPRHRPVLDGAWPNLFAGHHAGFAREDAGTADRAMKSRAYPSPFITTDRAGVQRV